MEEIAGLSHQELLEEMQLRQQRMHAAQGAVTAAEQEMMVRELRGRAAGARYVEVALCGVGDHGQELLRLAALRDKRGRVLLDYRQLRFGGQAVDCFPSQHLGVNSASRVRLGETELDGALRSLLGTVEVIEYDGDLLWEVGSTGDSLLHAYYDLSGRRALSAQEYAKQVGTRP